MSVWKTWRRRVPSTVCALVIVSSLLGAERCRAQVELKWAFEPGQKFGYEFSQTSKMTMRGGQGPEERTIGLTAGLAWEVKAVESGTATIEQTVERVRAEVKAGTQSVVYDSVKKEAAGPNASSLSELYGAVMAEPATLRIDARGRVVEARVPAKVREALRGSPFQNLADGGSLMSEKGIQNMLGQVLPLLPEGAISQGESWDSQLAIPAGPLQMKLATKYTLEAAENPIARISTVIDTEIEPQQGVPLKVTVKSQEGAGIFRFDTGVGQLTGSEIKQRFELGIEVGDQMFGQSLEIEITMKPLSEGP